MKVGGVREKLKIWENGPRLSPIRARVLLERLGPIFVKIGQYLSLRPDIIPQEYCNEFFRLQDDIAPDALGDSLDAIREGLGQDTKVLFGWIKPRPVGAGSLAQVYQARTHDGQEIVIKVLRKNIEARVRKDLAKTRLLGNLLHRIGMEPGISLPDLVQELENWLTNEVDLRNESRNLRRLSELTEGHPIMVVPLPHPKLSSQRILTTNFVRGVPFTHLVHLIRTGQGDTLNELGFDRKVLARNLVEAAYDQIFRFQLFHADTHPGNLLALEHNRIGYVDFGLVESLDESIRARVMSYVSAVYIGDVESMIHSLMELLVPGKEADPQAFRRDFQQAYMAFRESSVMQDVNRAPHLDRSPIAVLMVAILRAARRHDFWVPTDVLSIYRVLITVETIASELDPSINLRTVGQGYFRHMELENLVRMFGPEAILRHFRQMFDLLRRGPGILQRLAFDLAEDRFVLKVQTTESEASQRHANRRTRLVTLAILIVALSFLQVGTRGIVLPGGLSLSVILWVLIGAAGVWLAILWRALR